MKQPVILTFVYDEHLFYFTKEAIKNNKEQIGFYFDDLGTPQRILRKSIYGKIVLKRLEEIRG